MEVMKERNNKLLSWSRNYININWGFYINYVDIAGSLFSPGTLFKVGGGR